MPRSIELTFVEVNKSTPPKSSNLLSRAEMMLVFSIMYAIVVGFAGLCGDSNGRAVSQSKEIRASVMPCHTCISWYGCTRGASTWDHAPISTRNQKRVPMSKGVPVPCRFLTEAGVSELHLLEKFSRLASFCRRVFCKSWPSIRATRSPLVIGDAFSPDKRLNPAGPPPTQTTS